VRTALTHRRRRRDRRRRVWLPAIVASVLALVATGCGREPRATPQLPDVLLVVLDTVRADHSSAYGYPRPTTIQLSALSEVGVLFEDATASAPWTLPSHASLFTGEPPWVHGAHSIARADSDGTVLFGMDVSSLRSDLPTLAERFSAAGYRSVAIFANDWLGPELGLSRGFGDARLLPNDSEVVRSALEEIRRESEEPLFLFVNLMSAHAPYHEGPGQWTAQPVEWLDVDGAPPWLRPYVLDGERRGVQMSTERPDDPLGGVMRHLLGQLVIPADGFRWLAALYDAGVRGADFSFGQILEAWARRAPDGIAAVTSDHGEAFGEHGLLEHRASVYPEMLRVPLVVAAPGKLPAGVRIREPVAMSELHDALLELAGIEAEGTSQLVAVANGAKRMAPITAAAWPVASWAQQARGRYAIIWNLYREGSHALVWGGQGERELYDLSEDPAMEHDLAATQPERVAALHAAAQRHREANPEVEAAGVELPAELRARLSALGYSATQ